MAEKHIISTFLTFRLIHFDFATTGLFLFFTSFPKKEVFQQQFAIDEFDMVIADPYSIKCEINDIKHSKEAVPAQYRHLTDTEKCATTEFRYGTITKKKAIYKENNFVD